MSAETDRAALTQALRRQVDELSAELSRVRADAHTTSGDLAGLLGGLRARVEALEDQLTEPTDRRRPPPPVSWLQAQGPPTQPETLGELIGWLETVYLHLAPLPVCWLRHPGVIDKLMALAQAHWRAYHGPEASVAYAIHWQTREQPDITTWIDKHGRNCPAAHRHGAHPTGRPEAPLAAFADQIEATWTATQQLPPPTEAEIAAATQLATDHRR